MLIELESVYGDRIIHGKHFGKKDLRKALDEILNAADERAFISVFCARYGYEEVQCSDDVQVDYIIDLDTHRLIKPKYS